MNVSKTITEMLPAGTSIDYDNETVPFGFLAENGQALSKVTYARLYGAIGNINGVHADPSLFYVSDSRGRVTLSASNTSLISTKIGLEDVTLTESQMPSHTHIQNSHTHTTYTASSSSNGSAGGTPFLILNPNGNTVGSTTATNQNTGGGLAHTNMSPFLVTKKLIKY